MSRAELRRLEPYESSPAAQDRAGHPRGKDPGSSPLGLGIPSSWGGPAVFPLPREVRPGSFLVMPTEKQGWRGFYPALTTHSGRARGIGSAVHPGEDKTTRFAYSLSGQD